MPKVMNQGNSLYALIPKDVRRTLKIDKGTNVIWSFDEETGRWYLLKADSL